MLKIKTKLKRKKHNGDFMLTKILIQKIKNYAKGKTIQIPVSSGKDTAALYKRMGFKKMGNIWRYN